MHRLGVGHHADYIPPLVQIPAMLLTAPLGLPPLVGSPVRVHITEDHLAIAFEAIEHVSARRT